MRIEDRHRQIVEQVRGAGRVLVAELAEHFDVTPETIRRDLAALDRNGSLRKVHGGAISAPALPETGVTQREQVNICAKQAIARAALERLGPEPGTTLLVDAGTTTGAAARLLPAEGDLTIITNSVLTAASLTAAGHTRVRILGGQLRGLTQAAVGPEAVEALSTLRVDVALLGANGVSAAHGLSTPDPDEATVKRAMVRSARQVVALVDSTKIGQEHLVSFAGTDDVDLLVTDATITGHLAARLTDSGTEVIHA